MIFRLSISQRNYTNEKKKKAKRSLHDKELSRRNPRGENKVQATILQVKRIFEILLTFLTRNCE